jgi:SAM-dependent methyltransferase
VSTPTEPDFFTSGWAVYRLIVEHDYLWHAAAGRGLRALLDERFPAGTPVRVLDLACGDADTSTRVLAGRPLARYVGVDRSPEALASAKVHVARLTGPAELVEADFTDYLHAGAEPFDLIYVGLSAHHLDEPGLGRFFAGVRKRLAPGGAFAAYEPFLLPDETRDEHVERLCATAEKFYHDMTSAQRATVCAHVRGNDYPVTVARWDALATAAGLPPARRLFKSPDRLYELVAHS